MAEQVVFRVPLFTRVVTVLPAFGFAAFWGYLILFVGRPRDARPLPDLWYVAPFLWLGLGCILLALVCYRRTTAKPDALYVRRFRLRCIPWSEIEGMSPGVRFSNECLIVRLCAGGKLKLPAPVGDQWFGSHERFLDRSVELVDYWEAHRG